MNTEELRATFKDILNRTDCTEDQVNTLINLGLGRVERTLRLRISQSHRTFTGQSVIDLPEDFLSLSHVKLNGKTVQRVPETYDAEPGCLDPVYQVLEGQVVFPNPVVKPGDAVRVSYYRRSGEARYAEELPDLIIYAALTFAADLFVDDRKQGFEQTYLMIASEAQMASDIEQMTGLDLRVRNPYEGLV